MKEKAERKKNHCNICQKTIIGSSYKFKSHLYQHKAVQARFKCSYCSKEFFRNDIFTRHINSHTGTIKKKQHYICDHCDRCFVEKRNLILHLKVHDEHPALQYKCMACGANYCEERLLKYHIRKTHYNLHENQPLYLKKALNETWLERVKKSEVCVQMTKVNNNVISIKKIASIKNEEEKDVKKDEKTEFEEYMSSIFACQDKSQYSKATCDYCKKEMLKKSLLSHIRERHLKLRRFKCEECNSTFNRHYQLVDHRCGKFKPKRRRK